MILLQPRNAVVAFLMMAVFFSFRRKKRSSRPPGPPGWPLIGNVLSIPQAYTHKFYKELGDKLGSGIVYLEAFGQPIVVLNSIQVARDLLEKRSSVYSSRPPLTMLHDVMQVNHFFPFKPYGDIWRRERRIFTGYFSPKTLKRDESRIVNFVRKALLPGLYQSPSEYNYHIRSCIGGFFISVSYGVSIHRNNDPMIRMSEEAFNAITSALAPGRFLVDVFPVLKHVPQWMPGANFKKMAQKWSSLIIGIAEDSYKATLSALNDGSAKESFLTSNLALLAEKPSLDITVKEIGGIAASVYGAGFDTTAVALKSFILAMLLHPDIQKKAQEELDTVIGAERLPEFLDKQQMPYLSAVVKEVLRWNPILPLGIPHATTEDDSYEGYVIPRGSIVLSNIYAMFYDENIFPEPHLFKPDRFLLNKSLRPEIPLDPECTATFGFGRRVCPGAHYVAPMLFMATSSILALFNILPEIDELGRPAEVIPKFAPASLTSSPLPFKCRFVPRQGRAVESLLKDYLTSDII